MLLFITCQKADRLFKETIHQLSEENYIESNLELEPEPKQQLLMFDLSIYR